MIRVGGLKFARLRAAFCKSQQGRTFFQPAKFRDNRSVNFLSFDGASVDGSTSNKELNQRLKEIGRDFASMLEAGPKVSQIQSQIVRSNCLLDTVNFLQMLTHELFYLARANKFDFMSEESRRAQAFMKELTDAMIQTDFWRALWKEIDAGIKKGVPFTGSRMHTVTKFIQNYLHHIYMDTKIAESLPQNRDREKVIELFTYLLRNCVDHLLCSPRFYPKDFVRILRVEEKTMRLAKQLLERNSRTVRLLEEIGSLG